MKKILTLYILLLFSLDVLAQTPEVTISNKSLEEVKSKLIYSTATANPSWTIKSETSSSITVTRACGTALKCSFMQALIGNSYSSMLQLDLTYTLIKDGNSVKVLITNASAWTQMPGGQINSQSVLDGSVDDLQSQLNEFARRF